MKFAGAYKFGKSSAYAKAHSLALVSIMALLLGCTQQGQISVASNGGVLANSQPDPGSGGGGGSNPGGGGSTPPIPAVSYISMSKSVEIQATSKVDILVVIDNSKSMATEQQNMAARFSTFIDQLKGLDWQLAITTTDNSEDAPLKDGRLVDFDTSVSVLDSSMNVDTVKAAFAKAIQRPEIGSGYEEGIRSTYRVLERSQSSAAVNAGNKKLIRDGASLAVIVVTDSDETPYEDANGTPTYTSKELPANLLSYVNSTWNGQKTMSFHSIIVKNDDKECLAKDGNEAFGLHYIELSQKTNGIVGSVCEADYGSQLTIIGQKVQQLVKSVRLDCKPEDADKDGQLDLVVKNSNSTPVSGAHAESLDLIFDQALPLGVNTIEYKCLAK